MCEKNRLQRYSVRELVESFINGNRSFVKEYVEGDTKLMSLMVFYIVEFIDYQDGVATGELESFLRLMKG